MLVGVVGAGYGWRRASRSVPPPSVNVVSSRVSPRQDELVGLANREAVAIETATRDMTVEELAQELRAKDSMRVLDGVPQDKADAVRLLIARDTVAILDEAQMNAEFRSLTTIPGIETLPVEGEPLSELDREILERIAHDHEARLASLAHDALTRVQQDIAAKWDARQGLVTWRIGEPHATPVADEEHAGHFRRMGSGGVGGGLNFEFSYSSVHSPDVERPLSEIGELKRSIRAAQMEYIKNR